MEDYQKEINDLKSRIGGYQTSNENYRKKIQELSEELVATKERLCLELEKNEDYDKKNHDQINQFYREKELMRAKITQLEKEKEETESALLKLSEEFKLYKQRPWYKRMFAK